VYVLQIGTEKCINLVFTLFKISQKVLKAFYMCIFLKFLNHTHTRSDIQNQLLNLVESLCQVIAGDAAPLPASHPSSKKRRGENRL